MKKQDEKNRLKIILESLGLSTEQIGKELAELGDNKDEDLSETVAFNETYAGITFDDSCKL